MGGFESKKEDEKPELPTVDVLKDATFEHMPHYVRESAAAQELLGLSHPGQEIRDPWSIDADAPFDPMEGSQIAEDAEAKAMFNETFEAGNNVLGAFGIASGLNDMFDSKANAETRAKGFFGASTGLVSLAPGLSEVGPAAAAGVAAFDTTRRGSKDLQERGTFGDNEDGSHRDAADWSAHVGDEVGASLVFDGHGFHEEDGGVLGKIMGAPAVLGAAAVSGAMSFGAGAADMVVNDIGKSITMEDMQKMAVLSKQREAEKAAKEQQFQASLETMPEDERKKQEMLHAVQNLFGE